MSFDLERLYALLPAVYRIRDIEIAEQMGVPHGPLKGLLSVIAEQTSVLEDNLDQLYDDLFIETCAAWVVPYIGDLVGARGVAAFPGASFTDRAFVANTMAYRRRKGTAAVLEQLARDVTDWDASVVEYFQRLATTQYLNHLRSDNLAIVNVGNASSLESINTPFELVTRTADVRRIEPRRGKHNISNIGIFLWRLGSYSITDAPAFKLDEQRYQFDVLGQDVQLYSDPQTEDEITHLAEPINVPMPLRRRALARELGAYYGAGLSLLVTVDGEEIPVTNPSPPALPVSVCDLSDLRDQGGNVTGWAHMPTNKIAIDPELGRIVFPLTSPPSPPTSVRVSYHYGFSAEMGGGEYERETGFVLSSVPVKVPDDKSTIQEALDQVAAQGGAVEVTTNDRFTESLTIKVASTQNRVIELRAADGQRGAIVLSGNLEISGIDGAEVTLNGFVIAGGCLRVPQIDANGNPNGLQRLRLRHCTLVPGPNPAVCVGGSSPPGAASMDTIVEIDQCIVAPIRAVDGTQVIIRDSIIDAGSASGIAFSGLGDDDPGGSLTIENSTVIGKVHTHTMQLASNTIFFAELKSVDTWTAPVRAERLQQGCVRFSFVPPGSQMPRLHQCQPASPDDTARVRPVFTSLRYGDAAYCQLSQACAVEISAGADDRSEMGAFHQLYQPQREANLRASLNEYLRFGLEAGIFYAS